MREVGEKGGLCRKNVVQPNVYLIECFGAIFSFAVQKKVDHPKKVGRSDFPT
jgi:hypothetical protein